MKITSEQLKELLERATKGPWEVHESQTNNGRLSLEVGTKHEGGAHWCVADMVAPQSTIAKHNAALIALTPDLAAEVLELRGLLEQAVNESLGMTFAARRECLPFVHAARKHLAETEG